jgi:N-acylneuraminate cytidylyltransferase
MNAGEVLAIVPARGGSKGIRRKNICLLEGKPLLAHTIEHVRQSASVCRVVVSTDDPEVCEVAVRYGAEVIWRPDALSGDTASSESALAHVLEVLERDEQYVPDLVVFPQATSPLRRPGEIDGAIRVLLAEQADSLFSASPMHGFVWRVRDGKPEPLSYDYRCRPRRQDAPEDLVENGSIYVFKPWVLVRWNNRLGGRIAVYRMPVRYSFQVDEPSDLTLMESLLAAGAVTLEETLDGAGEIRLVVLDFDGVMTDNHVLADQHGIESVWCSRADGLAIELLRRVGIDVCVLSTEVNPVVSARCRKLGVDCMQGVAEKAQLLRKMSAERGLHRHQVAYMGNDVNDLGCMAWAGYPVAVADAVPEVRRAACFVTKRKGGGGAVRELADRLLAARAPVACDLVSGRKEQQ